MAILLARTFADPQVNLALELFVRLLAEQFHARLLSVMATGSLVFDDLAPGYGDLDFVAVIDGNLSGRDCDALKTLRELLRSGKFGSYAAMLEGSFLPRALLRPGKGRGWTWGGSGERPLTESKPGMGWELLRAHGAVLYGEDLRGAIQPATRAELLAEAAEFCATAREHGQPGRLHSVDWLLTAARILLWLREGRLCSKSDAAQWGSAHAQDPWRRHLLRAAQMRRTPTLAQTKRGAKWLAALRPVILAAAAELEREPELR